MKRVLYKITNLKTKYVLSAIPIIFILMLGIYYFKIKFPLFVYGSYLVSTYLLIIIVIWIEKYIHKKILDFIKINPYLYKYTTDIIFKTTANLYCSLVINMFVAGTNLFSGIYYHSFWFGTLAVYYIFLAFMRFVLLQHVKVYSVSRNLVSEFKQYRFCGIILLLLNIALSGVVILVIQQNKSFRYMGILIYIMAIYAFYSIGLAIYNIIKFRKLRSPILSASKVVNFIVALVSMFALETAMLAQFTTTRNSHFKQIMLTITGIIVCITSLTITVYMIIHGSQQINKNLKEIGANYI